MIDSGATHNFADASIVHKLEQIAGKRLWHWVGKPLAIQLADHTTIYSHKAMTLALDIGGRNQHVDFAIIDQLNHPLVLGMRWLKTAQPIINWANNTVEFPSTGTIVHPLQQPSSATLCSAQAFQ